MTDVKVEKKQGNIVSVTCEGHSGYGAYGEDVVCAGISTLTQTALLGLLNVARVKVDYQVNEKKGYLRFCLPSNLKEGQMHDCQVILQTMLCGLSDLHTEYSDFINLEVKE